MTRLNPLAYRVENLRWADAASRPFAEAKRRNFSYDQAVVEVQLGPSGNTLAGRLVARGLKPNFAYQIKLGGKPTAIFGEDGDDWANEQLGLAGRWWAEQFDAASDNLIRAWRSNDAEYHERRSRNFADETSRVVFTGYLLFDFILTDARGEASKDLSLESSYHVLWKTTQRPPRENDSPPRHHTLVALPESGWYDSPLPEEAVAVYAEWEPGRALPGECRLPAGYYDAQLILTEESFHEREPWSGNWASVLACDLSFTIQ